MKKILFIVVLFNFAFGGILDNKIQDIIGSKEYKIHNRLIKNIFNNKKQFINNEKINYLKLFKTLRQNGLLSLKFDKPTNIEITFDVNDSKFISYKILQDTIHLLGYRHVLVKSLSIDDNRHLSLTFSLKTEYMIDGYLLVKELRKDNGIVEDIIQQDKQHWKYKIDFKNAKINLAKKIPSYERAIFNKPLRPIFIEVNSNSKLEIISRVLNRWYPYVVFYDKELNILNSFQKDGVVKKIKLTIPKNCKYIMIKDKYNLINIKRGLTLILR